MRHAALALAAALALPTLLAAACGDDKAGGVASESTAALCSDQRDNDGDGFTDCADQDCWRSAACDGDAIGGDTATADTTSAADATTTAPGDDVAPDATADTSTPDDTDASGLCDPCGPGTVTGRVCAPNEHTYVSDALVVIDGTGCDGQLFHREVRSGADGSWTLTDVPCGLHNLVITKGSFVAASNVAVRSGQTTDLTGAGQKLCFDADTTAIAVLGGNWDDIEGLLAQLGLDYDLYSDDETAGAEGTLVDLLSSPEKLARYEIIFADCGGANGWMPQDHLDVMPNLKTWVLAGGSLYMSDYAWVYGEWAFPDAIEFQGSDSVFDMYTDKSPQMIPSDQTITATVTDGALATYLGKNTLTVVFDRGPQIAPDHAGTGTFAHVVGSFSPLLEIGTDFRASDVPLALSYVPSPGAGRVIYTNFHNDAQATDDMLTVIQYLVFTPVAADVAALPAALADWRATGRDLHVHGRRVFVHDLPGPTADAPVLAFLHGFPTSSHDLAPALAALRARCRVVAHDHVGFGLSEKPPGDAYGYSLFEQADVALGVWAALGVSRAHLVAHDYGTSVLTELLARRERGLLPLDVASITLSNGSVHLDLARLSWPQKLMRSPRVGPLFTRLASERLFHRRMRALFGRPDAVDPATVGAMWALVVHDGGRAALTPLSRYLDERVRYARRWHGALERCDLPAHVLWGRADPIAVPAIAERLAAEIPGATLTWLDDVGHYPTLEAPDRWAAAALAALPLTAHRAVALSPARQCAGRTICGDSDRRDGPVLVVAERAE